MDISIVVPTYNEKENIEELIPQIESIFAEKSFEIIVVDDDSPDGTKEAALTLHEKYGNICVLTPQEKSGIGAALKKGYDAAKRKFILSIDSDQSFSPKDLLRIVEQLDVGNDLVIGSRHMDSGKYEMETFSTKIKGLVSSLGNVLTRWISGIPVHDFSANLRGIKNRTWKTIQLKDNTNTMLLEMIMKVHYSGQRVMEIPVQFKERRHGKSKLNLKKEAPKFFMKLLWYTVLFRVLKKS